jgi:hypothetical protein
MHHRYLAASAAGTALVLLATGCSSGTSASPSSTPSATTTASAPPAAKLTAAAAAGAVKAAYRSATAVHIIGRVTKGGQTSTFDLRLDKNGSAGGTVSYKGAQMPIRLVHGVAYLQFTTSVLKAANVPAAMAGKWISSNSAAGKGMAKAFRPLLSYTTFVGGLVGQIPAGLTGGAATTIGGIKVQAFKARTGEMFYIAESDPHYLVRAIAPHGAGRMDFSAWNQPTSISAPTAAQLFKG